MLISRRTLLGAMAAGIATPSAALGPETPLMTVQFSFAEHVFTATLSDNPTARDFAAMLPLELKISDYANNEKIAYLPRKLTQAGSGRFANEAPGDLAYYAPWGNLVFYYAPYHYSPGLIRLGRLTTGIKPLMTRGEFPLLARLPG
ncbi:cyclophilin-like fold protein [Azorhizobium sp. AG788]|uniref:cyclophilin-like fold protein n=1 Tax=Azorhizobium sp. AG788 TaxID=2183897 RepID=UPI0031390635